MRKTRMILSVVAGLSLLVNAALAGVAVTLWSRLDRTGPPAMFLSLPEDLRRQIRADITDRDGSFRAARAELREARGRLTAELQRQRPNPLALERAMADIRAATERMQQDLHSRILRHYGR